MKSSMPFSAMAITEKMPKKYSRVVYFIPLASLRNGEVFINQIQSLNGDYIK